MVQPIRSPENPGTTVVSMGHLTPRPENPGYRISYIYLIVFVCRCRRVSVMSDMWLMTLLVFNYSALAFGNLRFPIAHQLAESKAHYRQQIISCSGFCGNGMILPRICSCDEICLYIGDCCFDFVYLCKRGYDLDTALAHQGQIISSFRNKTVCSVQYVQMFKERYKSIHIPMIMKCPSNATKRLLALCEDYEWHTFPVLPEIPVNHHGLIYKNIYCSICSGASPKEVNLLSHKLIDTTDFRDPISQPFALYITGLDHKQIVRFQLACGSIYKKDNLHCTTDDISEECVAYQAPISAALPNRSETTFKNLACANCVNATITSMRIPIPYAMSDGTVRRWISLFDFVGKSNYISSEKGAPKCDSTRCQDGYILRETSCTYCIKENTSKENTSIFVTWFQPTILLMLHAHDAADTVRNMYGRNFTHIDRYCTNTMHWLQDIGFDKLNAQDQGYKTACLLFPVSQLEVQFYINILRSDILMEQLMPGFRDKLQAAFVFNFDVKYKAKCEQGKIATIGILLADITERNGSKPDFQVHNVSYHRQAPWVFARSFMSVDDDGGVYELVCLYENENNFNCSHMNISDFNTCPKVEIQFVSMSENGFWTKNRHFINKPPDYILTSNQTVLLCANQCHMVSLVDTKTLDILVPICYSVSMSCLMTTFLIYLVTPQLRNIPGLMLMNLTVALFLAQMTYLINSYGIFINYPPWCQFLGATQHYFWLTAFAWMACITIDIYHCLSSFQVTHPDSLKKRYNKLVASCWLAPVILPLITICLQLSGSAAVGYGGQHTCWFINPDSVLYFFAIPVLTVVFINLTMFIGCVYRIRQISSNARYVGRKEDGKLRLLQCVKISSWIGTSWLFGILPNIINRPELWYIFTVCNALQGVQIFLAYGVSQKSLKFICNKITDPTDEPTMSTTVTAHTGF